MRASRPKGIRGYGRSAFGHLSAAHAVLTGEADCCIATRSAAQTFGLDFVPLRSEQYDFVLHRETLRLAAVQAMFDALQRATLRRKAGNPGRLRHIADRSDPCLIGGIKRAANHGFSQAFPPIVPNSVVGLWHCRRWLPAEQRRTIPSTSRWRRTLLKRRQEIARLFERTHGQKAVLSFGSTGQLFTQITQDAPFEVFLAADQETPMKVVAAGLWRPGHAIHLCDWEARSLQHEPRPLER